MALNNFWCLDHFTCRDCGRQLHGLFSEEDGHPYCEDCMGNKYPRKREDWKRRRERRWEREIREGREVGGGGGSYYIVQFTKKDIAA
jgi:hypothetical protein